MRELRDVGGMGEKRLGEWAGHVGIIANPATEDKRGWDYILELPAPGGAGLPLDLCDPPIQCWVQVKSTDQDLSSWSESVKLSNWNYLVETPLPAFFLILHWGGSLTLQNSFLVHVWREEIYRVKRALRELSSCKPDAPPHRHSLPLHFSAADRLESNDGFGLIAAIKKHVPNFESYGEAKRELIKSAGYENGGWSGHGTVRFPPKPAGISDEEHIVNWSLGLVGPATLTGRTEVFDERFGIRHPEPIRAFDDGRMVPRVAFAGSLHVRSPARSHTFNVEVYSSASVKAFVSDESKHKVRIKAVFFDFLIPHDNPSEWEFAFRFPEWNTPISAPDLRSIADVAAVFSDGPTLDVEIEWRDGREFRTLSLPEEARAHLSTLGRAIESLIRAARRLRIANTISATRNQLVSQAVELELIDRALRSDVAGGDVRFWLLADTETSPGAAVSTPIPLVAYVHKQVLRIIVVYTGILQRSGEVNHGMHEFSLLVETVQVHQAEALPEADVIDLDARCALETAVQGCLTLPVVRWWDSPPVIAASVNGST